jgi:hypothetical protein
LFVFADDHMGWNVDDFVASIPVGIGDRQALFDLLAFELELPDYFGHNWDALDECLNDLAWISSRRIVLRHTGLPQLPRKDLLIYLDVLGQAATQWASSPEHDFLVIFPTACRETIERLVGG